MLDREEICVVVNGRVGSKTSVFGGESDPETWTDGGPPARFFYGRFPSEMGS